MYFGGMNASHRISFIVLAGILGSCSPTPSAKAPVLEDDALVADHARVFQSLVDSMHAAHPGTKGIIMHVEAPAQDISWSGATGMADASGRSLEPETPVLIASVTKTYVAAATLRLIEQGKLGLHQPLTELLSVRTDSLLRSDGYDVEEITVMHLMSNTSGLFDYVNTDRFQHLTLYEPSHEWTRNEQLELAVVDGDPVAVPGHMFQYSETNFLLLTEIIEQLTGEPFYSAMRALLRYDALSLHATWFPLLEKTPEDVPALAQQYATSMGVNSYTMHGSFDAFGGGGIASTAGDLARFSQHLFEGRLFGKPETIRQMLSEVATTEPMTQPYHMGLAETQVLGKPAYGHGGFWGTVFKHLPHLNATVAVFVMERDQWQDCEVLIEHVAAELRSRK